MTKKRRALRVSIDYVSNNIFTVLWIIQSFFVPSVWCCNEKKKRKIVHQCQDYQQLVSQSVLMCYYLSSEKKCLFLFFLSVVTNHLIECTMNELELKMDVTVHLITSAYDMGNKSTATTIQQKLCLILYATGVFSTQQYDVCHVGLAFFGSLSLTRSEIALS